MPLRLCAIWHTCRCIFIRDMYPNWDTSRIIWRMFGRIFFPDDEALPVLGDGMGRADVEMIDEALRICGGRLLKCCR